MIFTSLLSPDTGFVTPLLLLGLKAGLSSPSVGSSNLPPLPRGGSVTPPKLFISGLFSQKSKGIEIILTNKIEK